MTDFITTKDVLSIYIKKKKGTNMIFRLNLKDVLGNFTFIKYSKLFTTIEYISNKNQSISLTNIFKIK